MAAPVEKIVLIRSGCFGLQQPFTLEIRAEFQRAVESVPGCAVIADNDNLKFNAPDEAAADQVDDALKGKYLGGVYMGLCNP